MLYVLKPLPGVERRETVGNRRSQDPRGKRPSRLRAASSKAAKFGRDRAGFVRSGDVFDDLNGGEAEG